MGCVPDGTQGAGAEREVRSRDNETYGCGG